MLRSRSRRPGDRPSAVDREAGNVALSLLVVMVVTLLTTAMFLGARRSLLQGRLDTEAGRAEATAELAIHEAFARIDRGETARFVGAGTVGDTSYQYTADPVDRSTWSVRAEASSGSLARALVATIGREARFPHTIFAIDELVSNRNTGLVSGRVGTNGTMTVRGLSPGDVQELYRPDGSCRRCANPLVLDGPRRLDPVVPPSGTVSPCPVDGRFADTVDGEVGTPIVCDDPSIPVVFDGPVQIDNPPLIVHIGPEVGLSLDGSEVNQGGRASDLRLFVHGEASDAESRVTATGADVTGLLYGPGRSLTTADTTWTGSMTLWRVEVGRGGRLTVSEDSTIGPLGYDRWRIVELGSTPSSP